MSVTQEQVLDVLRTVQDPDLHKDIVTLGFVKDVKIAGGEVDFTIELTTPACPVKDEMKAEAERKVAALPGVKAARAQMTADVRARGGFGRQAVPGIRNIIAVGAGKGGVGKSTTAVNLALALPAQGRARRPDGRRRLRPEHPADARHHGRARRSATDKKMIPPEAHGLKVISMGMLVPPDQPVIWRGPMLHGAVQQFMRDVEWGELDYLVVDLPPGTGDVSLSMAQSVPVAGAVVVTTPQGVSVSDVRKAVAMFRQLNIPILGVVENMSYFVCGHCDERTEIFGHGGGARMAEDMGIPFLGEVPIDTRVRSGGDEGTPIVAAAPDVAGGAGLRRRGRPGRGPGLDPEHEDVPGDPDRVGCRRRSRDRSRGARRRARRRPSRPRNRAPCAGTAGNGRPRRRRPHPDLSGRRPGSRLALPVSRIQPDLLSCSKPRESSMLQAPFLATFLLLLAAPTAAQVPSAVDRQKLDEAQQAYERGQELMGRE